MTRFDQLLRRGLMDANLAQYEKVLQQAESTEPDFSPAYLRERMRLLADPWGWMRRRGEGRGRLNWRLVILIAVLLFLLSACAYVVVTGQFSQWFPGLGVDPAAPETSEEVMSRTGTAIEQKQAAGDTTVTLNAALWDGDYVYLSLIIESPDIPEEVIRYSPLYTEECRLFLRDDQWKSYKREELEHFYAATGQPLNPLEDEIQTEIERGQKGNVPGFDVLGREGNKITVQLTAGLFTYVAHPELTLHLENIATYEDGKGEGVSFKDEIRTGPGPGAFILEGAIDFTFTLEKPILPINYGNASIEMTLLDVPLRFTGFKISATDVTALFDVLAPVDMPGPGEPPGSDKVGIEDIMFAASEGLRGLWTENGTYVDLTEEDSGGGSSTVSRRYPYPIDPAEITAVDLAGTRVELGGLERQTE